MTILDAILLGFSCGAIGGFVVLVTTALIERLRK